MLIMSKKEFVDYIGRKEFLDYIEGQLIPDLKEAEQNGTADDMEILLRIAREGLRHA